MEEVKNNPGQAIGIAALITAIITFVIAVIPCVGLIAVIPGIIAIVLASVGLSNSSRNSSPRGVLIAGLVIAVVASMISLSQIFIAGKLAKNADNFPEQIEKIVNDVQENVVKEIEDANVSIKVESNGEKIEINASSGKAEKEQTLEDLEYGNSNPDDTLGK